MHQFTIYHNPACSKSRATLTLLKENGIEPKVVEYLKTPPTVDELKSIAAKLCLQPAQLVRKGEEVFKTRFAGKELEDREWLEAMADHPILIERPIVVYGRHAVLGRPPENIHRLLR